jgi:hypothetical protein
LQPTARLCPAIPYRSNTKDIPAFFPKSAHRARHAGQGVRVGVTSLLTGAIRSFVVNELSPILVLLPRWQRKYIASPAGLIATEG